MPLVASILFVLAHKWLKIDNFWNFFFFQNWKTQLSKNIWIYVIAFAPIVIQTQQAPQNDHRNLSFVKGTIVVGNRMTRKGPKMTIWKGCLFNFRMDFSLLILNQIWGFERKFKKGLTLKVSKQVSKS